MPAEEGNEIAKLGEVLVGLKGSKWKVESLVGKGAYGAVVVAKNLKTNQVAALKLEDANQEVRTLRLEVGVLDDLVKRKATHCCEVFDRGRKADRYNWVAMTLVGDSLEKLQETYNPFSLGTAVHIAIETLEGLEELHDAGDIKPGNFAMCRPPDQRRIVVLDFGMARKYVKDSGRHRRARDVAGFRGTPYYASPIALAMGEQARRDDIWAWFFMIIEMTTGTLPWENLNYDHIEDPVEKLGQMGKDRQAALRNEGKELLSKSPVEYKEIFSLIIKLEFADKPQYAEMYKILRSIYQNRKMDPKALLDYEKTPIPKKRSPHKSTPDKPNPDTPQPSPSPKPKKNTK